MASSRGPYDRDENPFAGEPLHVQLLAKFPDDDDEYAVFVADVERLSPFAFEPPPSRAPLARPAPSKPALAEPLSSPPRGGSARGHNRKA